MLLAIGVFLVVTGIAIGVGWAISAIINAHRAQIEARGKAGGGRRKATKRAK